MSPTVEKAFRKIINLRKYPHPQSAIAESRILKTLNVPDFTATVEALEAYESTVKTPADKSVTNG